MSAEVTLRYFFVTYLNPRDCGALVLFPRRQRTVGTMGPAKWVKLAACIAIEGIGLGIIIVLNGSA